MTTAQPPATATWTPLLVRASSVRRSQRAVAGGKGQRLELSQKQAAEAYTLAEVFEANPRTVWGYVQGLTRLPASEYPRLLAIALLLRHSWCPIADTAAQERVRDLVLQAYAEYEETATEAAS